MVERAGQGQRIFLLDGECFMNFSWKGFFYLFVFTYGFTMYSYLAFCISSIKNNYNRWINVWKFSFVSYLFCVSGRLKTILNLRYLNWFFKKYAIKTFIILLLLPFGLTKHYFRFGQTVPQCNVYSLKQFSTYIPQKSAKWYNVFFFFK